jgi:hypothetical protein
MRAPIMTSSLPYPYPTQNMLLSCGDGSKPFGAGAVEERLAVVLIGLAECFEVETAHRLFITRPATREELAALAGAPSRDVDVSIERLRAWGLIAVRRARFILLAPEELRQLAIGQGPAWRVRFRSRPSGHEPHRFMDCGAIKPRI